MLETIYCTLGLLVYSYLFDLTTVPLGTGVPDGLMLVVVVVVTAAVVDPVSEVWPTGDCESPPATGPIRHVIGKS